jgi:hypothetical protein
MGIQEYNKAAIASCHDIQEGTMVKKQTNKPKVMHMKEPQNKICLNHNNFKHKSKNMS